MTEPAHALTPAAAGIDEAVDANEVADANDLRDTAVDDVDPVDAADLPLEADPADVAEQSVAVPYDDDER
jgi:hypothetical protein